MTWTDVFMKSLGVAILLSLVYALVTGEVSIVIHAVLSLGASFILIAADFRIEKEDE